MVLHNPALLRSAQLNDVEARFVRTSLGSSIALMVLRRSGACHTLLFAGGMRGDSCCRLDFLTELRDRLGCNVATFDYSGYGASSGTPSEMQIYDDVQAAYEKLCAMGTDPNSIVAYGHSMGSSACVHLASRVDNRLGALVLHACPRSILSRVGCGSSAAPSRFFRRWDLYRNYEKIVDVRCPTLIIHGTADKVVPFWHGRALHQACPNAVDPLWIEEGSHKLEDAIKKKGEDYWGALRNILDAMSRSENVHGV